MGKLRYSGGTLKEMKELLKIHDAQPIYNWRNDFINFNVFIEVYLFKK